MDKLLKFLRAHNITVRSHTQTSITVEEIFCVDGKAHSQDVIIDATVHAVRNWLGY